LARNMIRLSGFIPDEEIPISVIGLRPGEKLEEELIGHDEAFEPSSAGVFRVIPATSERRGLAKETLAELERLGATGDTAAVIAYLRKLVPTYDRSVEA